MRVISGRLRGAILRAPPGTDTRPITDRVKESLFNILGHRFGMPGLLPDTAVLDLFAGSGALGIEALSRGAGWCLFVERDRRALRVLQANIAGLRLSDRARVVGENAWTMRIPQGPTGGYGLIFVDPPYADLAEPFRASGLLDRLAAHLSADGLVVFRHRVAAKFAVDELRQLECVDERTFGRMRVLLLQRA